MDYSFKLLLLFLLTCSPSAKLIMAGPLNSTPTTDLAARIKLDNNESNCWDSLFHLQSCIGNAILFFLNGETYLGPSCCNAIRTIEHDCWPSMLGSLGFTSQEGNILRGYCDTTQSTTAHPPPPPPTPLLPEMASPSPSPLNSMFD